MRYGEMMLLSKKLVESETGIRSYPGRRYIDLLGLLISGLIDFLRKESISSAAFFPEATAWTTVLGPVRKSPA
jgi:hypothetical protein